MFLIDISRDKKKNIKASNATGAHRLIHASRDARTSSDTC